MMLTFQTKGAQRGGPSDDARHGSSSPRPHVLLRVRGRTGRDESGRVRLATGMAECKGHSSPPTANPHAVYGPWMDRRWGGGLVGGAVGLGTVVTEKTDTLIF